ncbi:MAG TPA: STAS domain-containing protein [Gemmatimonadales bacterium]|nr:STAS domain-containing protein [Gemmatimonadales bacterium]
MSTHVGSRLPALLREHEADLLREWTREQIQALAGQQGRISEAEIREQSREFLNLLQRAAQDGDLTKLQGARWQEVHDSLANLSRTRTRQGFTPAQTANFIFSLKRPLFALLRRELDTDPAALAEETWMVTELLDQLGLHTAETFIKTREGIISRQQEEMLELSTPVVKLWEGVLALPMIGTLDSARTQIVMESLLQRIVETGAEVAIIDITGVPTVDTLVAQHLIKTVTAARLMGADCIISGIRPQIAQTIVHLGVDLGDVVTKASLADAFAVALQRRGLALVPSKTQQ